MGRRLVRSEAYGSGLSCDAWTKDASCKRSEESRAPLGDDHGVRHDFPTQPLDATCHSSRFA